MKKRIMIIGCGNLLLRDEGFGIHVVKELTEMKLPKNVEVCDAGTVGWAILDVLHDADKVVVIDSMKLGLKPGTIKKFDLRNLPEHSIFLSWPHEWDLLSVLKLGGKISALPELTVIGVEAREVDKYEIGLSNELEAAKEKVIKMILDEIEQSTKN